MGMGAAVANFVHALLAEYLPFVILLTALYVVAGGIYIRGSLTGTPVLNTAILAIGAVLASFMGTTGASMLLIRPLIRANAHRSKVVHIVVFFHLHRLQRGGWLTPLGDPPLFLGFLKGVDFIWTLLHIWPEALFLVGVLLAMFFVLDTWLCKNDSDQLPWHRARAGPRSAWALTASSTLRCWRVVVGLVLLSGMWKSDVVFTIAGTEVGLPGVVRDVGLIVVAVLSLLLTPQSGACRQPVWLGADAGSGQAVCRYFPDHHPRDRHAQSRRRWPVWCHRAQPSPTRWHAQPGHVLLGHRRAVFLPGQRAHLSGVLQHGGRRPCRADDRLGAYAGGRFRRVPCSWARTHTLATRPT